MLFRKILIVFAVLLSNIAAQDTIQTFLSLEGTGVAEFQRLYPEYDGRGTIIFIFDTGVDMGIDGLTQTSTGEVKVIDVQDFSTQGDISLYEAETEEEDGTGYFVNEEMSYRVAGAGKLPLNSYDETYLIGVFSEKSLLNSSSGSADINGNGNTEDLYYLVTLPVGINGIDYWVAFIDLDSDGDLSDELPVRNYKENFDSFTILRNEGLPPFTFGLNIFPEERRISIHFDDGAHGTHVAGIAAGYKIGNNDFMGVAPGAYIISCKLGNNLFAGGATVSESMKKSFLYADKISKERKEPCIINMSFGIGSEIEGQAEMETFISELVKNNPYLYICTSNGNEGPGISTAGLPAASNYVFSSGAVLTEEVGRDLYGTSFKNDIILYFSSRGGEVSKPDVISPGACVSTVPNWTGNDRFWGTSMASPYSAGVMSLLLSAAEKEFPGVKIPSVFLYKVVRESAVYNEKYNVLDQGHGFINVINAFELLKKYINSGELQKFESYTIRSVAPNMPGYSAPNLYLRDGSFLTGNDTFNFFVTRNNFQNTEKFYRTYTIKSNSDWLEVIQKKTYLRNNQGTYISVKPVKSKIEQPGLYTAKITAFRDDKSETPEFTMLATVVIPYIFNQQNNYRMEWNDVSIEPGMVNRYFIKIPPGQSSMKIKLSADEKNYCKARFRLHDPDGRSLDLSSTLNTTDGEYVIENNYYDLSPGVYELLVEGHFTATGNSVYNLSVGFRSIIRQGKELISSKHNSIEMINLFNKEEEYKLNGSITGYERTFVVKLEGEDYFSMPFVLKENEASKQFKVILSREDFNKITDFSLRILDKNGIAVNKNGLSYREGDISVSSNSDSGTVEYKLELIPAFAYEPGELTITVEEVTTFKETTGLSVVYNKRPAVILYPSVPKSLSIGYTYPDAGIPEDANLTGKISFESVSTGKIEYELPVSFNNR